MIVNSRITLKTDLKIGYTNVRRVGHAGKMDFGLEEYH